MHASPTRARRRALPRLAAIGAAALAAIGLSLAAATAAAAPALAHDELVGYDVEVDAATGAALAITLSFSNDIVDVGTEIVITGPDGADVADGAPTIAGRDVRQPLAPMLVEGDYTVAWRVVSSDGHPIQGAFSLLVSETGEATLAEAGPEQEHGEAEEGHEHADHDQSDHAHADEPEEPGQPWWVWMLVSVGAVGVAASIATSAVVGAKRRREAMGGSGASAEADE